MFRQLLGHHGPELDDGVVALALTRRARATTPAWFSGRSGVSKKNTWRIWASSGSISRARPSTGAQLRHGQLQLDAVGILDEIQEFDQLVGDERVGLRHGAPRFERTIASR